MMRRRAVGRRGPGVVGTMARTAVIAGTATATSMAVSNRVDARQQRKQQEQMADVTAMQTQDEVAQLQNQVAELQAQQAYPPPQAYPPQMMPEQAPPVAAASTASPDLTAQLQQLAQLKDAGILTDDEFLAAKAKLLGI